MAASIEHWRVALCELASWMCDYDAISKDHPRYIEVTEGRDSPPNRKYYSSCADAAMYLAKRAGVRKSWINRDDDNLHGPWVRAMNVAKLNEATKPTPADYLPGQGDIWIVSNTWPAGQDAHVCICLGPTPGKPGEFLTCNYGASGLLGVAFPGGKISSKPYVGGKYGAKKLVEVLTVPDLVAQVTEKPDFSGADRWSDVWTGEVRDAVEGHLT